MVKSVRAPLTLCAQSQKGAPQGTVPHARTSWAARGRRRSCLGPNGPGTGPPSLVVGRRGRRPSRCPRARDNRSRRSNVAVPGNPSLRSKLSRRARAGEELLAACGGSLGNTSRYALADKTASCLPPACRASPHGWRSLPQGVQTGQPPQRAECVGAPAQTRERALRAPSRDWLAWWCLTRQREPARPLRCANRFAGYADASLCYRHVSVARQARHRCASTATDAGLAALAESLAARASRVGSRRKARPPRPMRAAADCEAWRRHPRSDYASRSCEAGPARGTVRQHTQTAAADKA